MVYHHQNSKNIIVDKYNNKWYTSFFNLVGALFVYNEDGLQGVNGVDDEKNLHAFEMNAFPNPATDFIEINNVILNEVKEPVVLVYNVLGGKLMDSRLRGNDIFVSTEGDVRLDISALSPGVYFVSVSGRMYKF